MIKNAYTDSVKKKMGYAIVPFIVGALVLVGVMGQGIDDKSIRLIMLIAGLVLFVIGLLMFVKYAKELNDYAKAYWEKEDQKNSDKQQKQENPGREKITWAEAKNEYKEEVRAAALESSRKAAEQIAKAEAEYLASQSKSKNE